jgi:antitoxin FitA
MSRTITIRDVPDAVHRKLKSRAKKAGMSLSKYLLAEVREMTQHPTMQEVLTRLDSHEPVSLAVSAAETIREMRREN